jgi:hypothetical protein
MGASDGARDPCAGKARALPVDIQYETELRAAAME